MLKIKFWKTIFINSKHLGFFFKLSILKGGGGGTGGTYSYQGIYQSKNFPYYILKRKQ